MVKSVLFCFMCQTCFESSVSFKCFLCVKDLIIPVSLFKCVCSHANVVLCVLCVACINGCFVYNVLTHALVLQWACVLVPTVTVLCDNLLWLAS